MKRILYILCSILLLTGGLSAQAKKKGADHHKDIREKVRAEKRAYLMRELSLTAGEVDALMPVLNELISGKRGATAQVIGALQLSFADVEVQHLLEVGIQLGFGQRLVALTYATAEGLGRAP